MSLDSSRDFDLIILGGGTGADSAAFRVSQLALRVAPVEQAKIGGTCLHLGWVPTKGPLESAELYARLRRAKAFGLAATALVVASSTHPYPTLVEALGEAVMAVQGRQINA
jgi:dihydrolipoamide dehydrogenase